MQKNIQTKSGRFSTNIIFRASVSDKKMLEKKTKEAGFNDISSYLRYLIYNAPSNHPEIQNSIHDLVYEINKIGININQITKDYNSNIFSSNEKEILENKMADLKYLILDLREKLSQE